MTSQPNPGSPEAESMTRVEFLARILAGNANEPEKWPAYIETAKAQIIQSYKLRRPL